MPLKLIFFSILSNFFSTLLFLNSSLSNLALNLFSKEQKKADNEKNVQKCELLKITFFKNKKKLNIYIIKNTII